MNPVTVITGILLFKKPNKYTVESTVSPGIHIIPYQCKIGGISNDEYIAVGTRCGTAEFSQDRVDDYTAYKLNYMTMNDILLQNNIIFDMDEFKRNWKVYCDSQWRDWFGEDFIVCY
jgi:hypothetical protein